VEPPPRITPPARFTLQAARARRQQPPPPASDPAARDLPVRGDGFRSPANQAGQVSLVSGDATTHEDSVLSVDLDDVDAAYTLAQATGLFPDCDKCQAYIADVHSAFRSGS
jgi:hypothetical protein